MTQSLSRTFRLVSLDYPWEELDKKWIFLTPFLVALFIRLIYHTLGIPDFWGDSYHTIYISWATLENDWVYADYKGREVVWLPFYRYISTFFLFLFQKFDLTIPHYLNMLLGSTTCGVIAYLTSSLSNQKVGVFAGLILALSGWHVAYSHMNMPEVMALLILSLAFLAWSKQQLLWLIPLGFAGVLTRNELTLLLAVFGLVLLIKKDWKPAIYLFIGSVTGLGLWVWWNFLKRGEIFWWIESRSRGNAWDRILVISQGAYFSEWYIHLAIFISVFPTIVILLLFFKKFRGGLRAMTIWKNKVVLATLSVVLFHWVFLLIMHTQYFSAPNGRFWLYSLPLACSFYAVIVYHLKPSDQKVVIGLSNTLCFAILIFMFFLFFQQRKIYAFHQDMGNYIANEVPEEVNLWLDYPDILYFSQIDYSRVYSSDQILPMQSRFIPDEERDALIAQQFRELNIQYLVASPVSYSIVLFLWPQMEKKEAFEWRSFKFTPVFDKFSTKDQIVEQPVAGWLRYMGGVGKKAVLWKVESLGE